MTAIRTVVAAALALGLQACALLAAFPSSMPGDAERAQELQRGVRGFMASYQHAAADDCRAAASYVVPSDRGRFLERFRAEPVKVTQIDMEKWIWLPQTAAGAYRASTTLSLDYTRQGSIVVKKKELVLTWEQVGNDWLISGGLVDPAADPAASAPAPASAPTPANDAASAPVNVPVTTH